MTFKNTPILASGLLCAVSAAVYAATPCGYPRHPQFDGGATCHQTNNPGGGWTYWCSDTKASVQGGCTSSNNTNNCLTGTQVAVFPHWVPASANSCDNGCITNSQSNLVTYTAVTSTGKCVLVPEDTTIAPN